MTIQHNLGLLIDTHCHLDFAQFDADRAQVLRAAGDNGVSRILVAGVTPAQFPRAAALVDAAQSTPDRPILSLAAGLHPWWMADYCRMHGSQSPTVLVAALAPLLAHAAVCALGETGLDGAIDFPIAQQEPLLRAQLRLACEHDLPVILHSRKSHAALLAIIKDCTAGQYGDRLRGVIHGFSGSYEQARDFYRANFLLGVGGVATYARAQKTRDAFARLPLEALVLETDAPDMPPFGQQGQRNTPAALRAIAEALAALRGQPFDAIAAQTTRNACRLFGWPLPAAIN